MRVAEQDLDNRGPPTGAHNNKFSEQAYKEYEHASQRI
ncbi:hypothetical protein FHU41_001857 [Psychromicrobium silvestre]|uniref:Uncharacterized protein n=1 Tax=Psychromicrobium silvestre TaxID=1645614 RepID=A0A7Y9LU24_9MICC|nr:hypothetical protein [Psychromicrobium silvestre]